MINKTTAKILSGKRSLDSVGRKGQPETADAAKENKYGLKTKILLLVSGIVIGVVNGLLGGGGGMLVVPALVYFAKLPAKTAHATAILVILPVSIISAAVYLITGGLKFDLSLTTCAGVVAGGVLGALLLKKLDSKYIKLIFAMLMIVAGLKMILANS